jgi:hypothetical protein
MRRTVLALWLAAPLIVARARAAWQPGGVPVGLCCNDRVIVSGDGLGGAWAAWSNGFYLGLTHLNAAGDPAQGWTLGGSAIYTPSIGNVLRALVADGGGGVYAVWLNTGCTAHCGPFPPSYLRVQHFLTDGSVAAGWPPEGLLANTQFLPYFRTCPDTCGDPVSVAPDGAGGLLLAWERAFALNGSDADIHAQHITPGGVVAWGDTGIVVIAAANRQSAPSIVADGAGGAFVAWRDARNPLVAVLVYGQHLSAAGSRLWPAGGIALSSDAAVFHAHPPLAVRDAAGGLIVVWPERDGADVPLFATRITAAHAILWSAMPVCAAPGFRALTFAQPDGSGGALVAWNDARDGGSLYGARILDDGSIAPGWNDQGVRLSSPAATLGGAAIDTHGGLYVTWVDNHLGHPAAIAQHITGDGTIAAGWPPLGTSLSARPSVDALASSPDGIEGAVVAWISDGDSLPPLQYVQSLAADGPVDVLAAVARAEVSGDAVDLEWRTAPSIVAGIERSDDGTAWRSIGRAAADGVGVLEWRDTGLAPGRHGYRVALPEAPSAGEVWVEVAAARFALLGARPQPAGARLVVRVELPSAEPASVELLDVTGRRLVARSVSGIGAHDVSLDGVPLPPGIYLVTLRQGARRAALHVPVVR